VSELKPPHRQTSSDITVQCSLSVVRIVYTFYKWVPYIQCTYISCLEIITPDNHNELNYKHMTFFVAFHVCQARSNRWVVLSKNSI